MNAKNKKWNQSVKMGDNALKNLVVYYSMTNFLYRFLMISKEIEGRKKMINTKWFLPKEWQRVEI